MCQIAHCRFFVPYTKQSRLSSLGQKVLRICKKHYICTAMYAYTTFLLALALCLFPSATPPLLVTDDQVEHLSFHLNRQPYHLNEKITPRPLEPSDDPEALAVEAEEESNLWLEDQDWVQIIRQDHRWNPTVGIGIGFSFSADIDTFPYQPEKVSIQFKDFTFGGTHFSKRDANNFSGVYNNISADIKLEVLSIENDTIEGVFSGVLISGSGKMAHLEEGSFRVGLVRK